VRSAAFGACIINPQASHTADLLDRDGHRRAKSEIATYFAGQSNQDNSCVAVMEGLRALRRKLFGRGKRRGNLTTKKLQSSQALLVATGL
jgi:hypothetical protein